MEKDVGEIIRKRKILFKIVTLLLVHAVHCQASRDSTGAATPSPPTKGRTQGEGYPASNSAA